MSQILLILQLESAGYQGLIEFFGNLFAKSDDKD